MSLYGPAVIFIKTVFFFIDMRRIRFEEREQREFLDLVIEKLNSPSLRGILQFGFVVPYSTLKNYYNELRLLPEGLFNDLCEVARIDKESLDFELVDDNWGKVRGGRVSKRSSI